MVHTLSYATVSCLFWDILVILSRCLSAFSMVIVTYYTNTYSTVLQAKTNFYLMRFRPHCKPSSVSSAKSIFNNFPSRVLRSVCKPWAHLLFLGNHLFIFCIPQLHSFVKMSDVMMYWPSKKNFPYLLYFHSYIPQKM